MIDTDTGREIAEPRVYLSCDACSWFPRYVGETEEEHAKRCSFAEASKNWTYSPPLLPPEKRKDATGEIRTFDSGATRDTDSGKLDYEGFLSPLTLPRYAEYMHSHRRQSDGNVRPSDNWQKGIPLDAYMKSLWRHLIEVWSLHRLETGERDFSIEEALCAIIFNASGYLHELLKGQDS